MHPRTWPLQSHLELGAFPSAVSCARLHAKHVAWEWGFNELAETIELLVAELATNAVQAVDSRTYPASIHLRLSSDKLRLLIEVWDANPWPPMARALTNDGVPGLDEEGGRGLFLVASLSQRWSWYPTPRRGGKVVWCELTVQPRHADEQPVTHSDTAGRAGDSRFSRVRRSRHTSRGSTSDGTDDPTPRDTPTSSQQPLADPQPVETPRPGQHQDELVFVTNQSPHTHSGKERP